MKMSWGKRISGIVLSTAMGIAIGISDANAQDMFLLPTEPSSKKAIIPFDPSDLNEGYFKDFEIVIRINKAQSGRTAQTLALYKNGERKIFTLVSTGREKKEKTKWIGGPSRQYYSNTPVGYYKPYSVVRNHYSKLWKTDMPFSVFFNNGVAIHQAGSSWFTDTQKKLGKAASGGCVRVSKVAAPQIYNYVKAAGRGLTPKIASTGEAILDENGAFKMEQGYRTLVIVENKVE